MKIRYIKGTRVIGGVSIGEGEYYTFAPAHLNDEYIGKRIKKALLEGRIEEISPNSKQAKAVPVAEDKSSKKGNG